MSVISRILSLKTQHDSLKSSIIRERLKPSADALSLKVLKIQKLKIKEELQKLLTK